MSPEWLFAAAALVTAVAGLIKVVRRK